MSGMIGAREAPPKHKSVEWYTPAWIYDGGMPMKEISAITGIPLATTESFAKRTRRPVLTGTDN